MDAIKLAIRNLQNEPTLRRASTKAPDIEDAVSQLSSTIILFGLSSTSESTFSRLSQLLRGRLLPLYRTSPTLTLEYVVAVFRYIHQNRLPTIHASGSKCSWEAVLESLFSGLLDFLEEDANSKHRETVGTAFYAALCPVFFCTSGDSPLDHDGSLLSTVYQLLTTTVEGTPKNAVKLREPDMLGSKRLGFTISQTKEYLALESLLELFALLIPPVKGGRQKRARFIKDVFDPSIFICSDRITRALEDIANPDWSDTSAQIMKELAESDIMSPQPFEVSKLTLDSMRIDTSTFFIDKFKFVANVDQHGKIETLHIPFSTISKITTSDSTLSHHETLITAGVTKAPVLGDKPIPSVRPIGRELVLSWHIPKNSLERFKQVMRHRDLMKQLEIHPRRKQSKTEEISLNFEFEKQDSLALRMDRVQSLSQLWADKTPRSAHISPTYSTPLVPADSNSKQKSDGQMEVQTTDSGEDSKTETAVFVADGDLTFHSIHAHQEIRAKKQPSKPEDSVHNLEMLKPIVLHDESSEEGSPQPRFKPTNKRRYISLTDDDDASGIEHATSDGNANLFVNRTAATSPGIRSPPIRPTEHSQLDEPNGSPRPTRQLVKEQITAQNLVNIEPFLDLSCTKGPRKRPHDALAEDTSAREETRYTKQLRLDAQKLSDESSHQDTKKVQVSNTSSPLPKELDFDEIPRTTKETKKIQMKGKNGKTAAPGKRVPVKKSDRAIRKKPGHDVSKPAIPRQVIYPDPDVTLVVSKEKVDNFSVIEKSDETSNRRSKRVATIQTTKKSEQKQPSVFKKAEKAPWEKKNFLPHKDSPLKALNDDKVQNPKPSSGTRDDRHVPPVPEYTAVQLTVENGQSDIGDQSGACGQSFHDHIIPTKLGSMSSVSPSNSPVSKIKSEPILIDLTWDISPQKSRTPNTSSQIGKKHLLGKSDSHKQTTLISRSTNDLSKSGTDVESRSKAVAVEKAAALPKAAKLVIFKQDAQHHFFQSGGDPSNLDAASPEECFVPKETSPLPRLQIPASSRINIDKVHSYPEILGAVDIQRSPVSKPREAKIQITGIRQMKSFGSVTADDTYAHHHRSLVDLDSFKTKYHSRPRVHNSKQDWTRTRTRISELDDFNPGTTANKSPISVFKKATDPRSNFEHKVQPMDKIISILDKLNEGIINKVARRFEGVSTELHFGQQMILENAARDLKEISNQSIHHFNDLVDLEAEYTNQVKIIANGVHNFRKCSEQLNQCYKNIVLEHNNRSLSRKFPKTLFPKFPEILSNPEIRR